MKLPTDQELLLRIQDDDQQAFAVVVERYQLQLYKQILKKIGDTDQSKDILQNILITLWTSRHKLVIIDSLYPYLVKAARYAVVRYYLLQKKNILLETELSKWPENFQHSAESDMLAADLKEELEAELLKLPDAVQQVFQLSRKEGLSVREIALQMNLSEQTVKNYISSALQTLRIYLKKEDLAYFISLASAVWFGR